MLERVGLGGVAGGRRRARCVRAPTLRRLAMRNVARRRGEGALVIVGCLLGAAIITSSLLVGDSLRASVRDVARTELGPVDEVVQVPATRLAAAETAVRGRLPAGAAVLPVVRAAGVAVSTGGPRRDSSPGNPVDAATLALQPGVQAVAPLVRAYPEFSAPRHPEFGRWYLTGFDDRLLRKGAPALGTRDARYSSDRAAFQAVLRSPSLAIVPDWFLQVGGGTEAHYVKVGESIVMRDPASGATRKLRVAGIVDADWALGGVMVASSTAKALLGRDAVASRAFVAVTPGADPDEVAASLTGRLVDHGADAESLRAVVDRSLSASRSFMALSQGFVALGLVIGVGGLGVVMIRAVRERRRQIGMLRAMGLPARTVRRAFVLESAFIAARGLLTGGGLALLSCWLLASRSDALGERGIPFSAPSGTLALMFAVALVASLAATAVPAARAARIRPAVALRVGE
jgi:putative ABC transport system permease protein